MNDAERRFAAYLDNHGYEWVFEPDWRSESGVEITTNPDCLVRARRSAVVCEVRQFQTRALSKRMEGQRVGVLAEKHIFAPLRSALIEKADQLRPLAGQGLPLVIVVSNPLQADVWLRSDFVIAAMFGNPGWRFPVARGAGEKAAPPEFVNRRLVR